MAKNLWRLNPVTTSLFFILVAAPLCAARAQAQKLSSARIYTDINTSIQDASAYYGVDAALVRSVVQAESNYNPWAISGKGALGLMQLMPETAWRLGVRNPFNPRQNIFAGTLYLKELLEKYRTSNLALAAYNAGDGRVQQYHGVPPYRETIQYINRIARLYRSHRFYELRSASFTYYTLGDHKPTQ